MTGLSSRAVLGDFFVTLEGMFDQTWVSKLIGGSPMSSNQQWEEHRFLGQVPPLRKWSGQRAPYKPVSSKIQVVNDVYETSMTIPIDEMRRDKTGQIQKRVNELSDRVVDFFDYTLSTYIAAGNATTYGLAYDGQKYFDTDHSEEKSGTQLNYLQAAQVSQLNVNTAAAPTEQEMAQALLGVIGYMLTYKDNQGQPMNGRARNFIAMVPVNLWGPTLAACTKVSLIGASGAVGDNPLKGTGFSVTAVCNPRLTTTTDGFVFRTDGPTSPMIVQEEVGVKVVTLAEGSDYEVENRAHFYGVEWVGGFAYGQWQYAAQFVLS